MESLSDENINNAELIVKYYNYKFKICILKLFGDI